MNNPRKAGKRTGKRTRVRACGHENIVRKYDTLLRFITRIKKQYYIGDEEKSLCLVRWPLIYFKGLLSLRLTLKIQITLPFAGTGGQNDSRHISQLQGQGLLMISKCDRCSYFALATLFMRYSTTYPEHKKPKTIIKRH